MESSKALENANKFLNQTLTVARTSNSFVNQEIDRKARSLTLAIKKEFKVDYSKNVNFKPKEKERLTQIYIDFLTGKSDDFNSHYIQLLAWHLLELKVMPTKNGGKVSICEYTPNPLAIFTVIEKTFILFQKKRVDVNKVSYALILNYLNNYKIVSNRYKNVLRKYLKRIKFSGDLDVYFNINNVLAYTLNKTAKIGTSMESYPERLLRLKIRPRTLDTVYFADSWFVWMFKVANLTDTDILKNINCSYFKICNEDMQKIILAKIIYDNNLRFVKNRETEQICMKYLFPAIKKGNPFKKEYWDLNYTGEYKTYLDSTWDYIEQTFVNNSEYKCMINFKG